MSASSAPRFFAFISDIHGNVDALEAVLADIAPQDVRGIFCLGDIVGYGPEPAACVDYVKETCAVTVLGNHEAMLFAIRGGMDIGMRKTIAAPLELALGQLSDSQIAWLRGLPLVAEIDPIILSHSSLEDPAEFGYLHSSEEADRHFAMQKFEVSFQGHTHVPVLWKEGADEAECYAPPERPVRLDPGAKYSVNVGSVGQPRDDDPRASYVLYDPGTRILLYRRVGYDIKRARARFKKAGLPAQNSERLSRGQ